MFVKKRIIIFIKEESKLEKSSFFFNIVDSDIEKVNQFLEDLNHYAVDNEFQIYILNKPMMERETDYNTDDLMILMSPGHKISLISLKNNKDEESFEEIIEILIEDIGYQSKKFQYTNIIGRPKKWERHIKIFNLNEIYSSENYDEISEHFEAMKYLQPEEKRVVDLIISLVTGSINNINAIGKVNPMTLLEKIRQKIILFDGDQTRFIYEDLDQDIVKIQGLAGTGKTELLLHRLKELYTENDSNKIAFACHNIALANKLKTRVPEFFDFMKVEEQIKWNERLWVFHGWGSVKNSYNLGLYGLICKIYNLPFYNVGDGDFQSACRKTLSYFEKMISSGEGIEPYFDYILIDEAQDFPDEFIKLCKISTKKTLYLAGDIFQDIFEMQELASEPDFSLSKVYRTHPKNLMFAHAVGMGLFERPTITWLEDSTWETCGYLINKNDRRYKLTREKILRFEDLESDELEYTKIVPTYDVLESIIQCIKEIECNHPDVLAEDIAIIFTDDKLSRYDYDLISKLEIEIFRNFKWNSSVTYKDKKVGKDKVTISNKNNIKGLEFPFVICVTNHQITRHPKGRNTLYMSLTRSFLTSYLVVATSNNEEIIETFYKGLELIKNTDSIITLEPTEEEKATQKKLLMELKAPKKSQFEVLEEIFNDFEINENDRIRFQSAIAILNSQTTDKAKLETIIRNLMEV